MPNVNPYTIAERAVPAMEAMGFLNDIDLGNGLEAQLGILKDGSAGAAHIRISVPHTTIESGCGAQPVRTRYIRLPIGHFKPEIQEWVVYPELFRKNERAGMIDDIEGLEAEERDNLIRAANVEGGRFIDLRHPLTQEAREMTSSFLVKSKIAQRIIEGPDHNSPLPRAIRQSHDKHSSVFAVSGAVMFAVCFQGLLNTDDPYKVRSRHPHFLRGETYEVHAFTPGSSGWNFPHRSHGKRSRGELDFKALSYLHDRLFTIEAEFPDFSGKVCAVGYNVDNH